MYEVAVATLEGASEAELVDRTRRWFDAEVAWRLRPGAREALDAHRDAGDRLVIATSSSPYAAENALRCFGLDEYVSSRFEVVDGRFTGKLAASALGDAKAERVQEWAERNDVQLADCTFYTDSATDRALLERVGSPVAVNPDRALVRLAAQKDWQIVDWGTATPPADRRGFR